jgi:hypothetical protein
MKPLTPNEIEALRRRWREILKRAQEKGENPSAADIEAAYASNDPFTVELVVATEKALEDYKRRLDRLKTNPEDFKPAATQRTGSLLTELLRQTLKP